MWPVCQTYLRQVMGLALVLTGCSRESGQPEASDHQVPTAPAQFVAGQPDLEAHGRYVYKRNCLVCHGRWGNGRGEMAMGMTPRPSNFTHGRFKFRSTPSGFLPTDDDLRRVVTGGIAGSSMPAFLNLSDRDLNAVIAHLKSFSRRWDDPGHRTEPIAFPLPPPWLDDPIERTDRVRHGRELFTANCATCHGNEGRGDGPAAANLVDDAAEPAPPANFLSGLWKSGSQPNDLFRTLSTGLDGTPMPSFAETLSDDDRWDLVGFLLTLPSSP